MSQLSELTASHRADVVDGYILSRPQIPQYGAAEDVFARRYMRQAVKSCVGLPVEIQEKVIGLALSHVKAGEFTLGMPGFDAMARSSWGTIYMFWHCLRVKHKDVTLAKAREIFVGTPNEESTVRAVYELLGYLPTDGSKKKAQTKSRRRSPGPSSSKSSAPAADSPGNKSES